MRYSVDRTSPQAIRSGRQPAAAAPPIRRLIVLPFVLGILAYALCFSFWQFEPVPTPVYLAAVLVAATCLFPMAHWYARGGTELPVFELICLSYALQFSLPVYTQPNRVIIQSQPVHLSWDGVYTALLAVELGVLAMIAGYYVARRSPLAHWLPRFDLPLPLERRATYLRLALPVGGMVTLLNAVGWAPLQAKSVGAIVFLLASQLNMAIFLLTYTVYQAEKPGTAWRLSLYVTVAIAFAIGLTTGMLESAMIPLAVFLIARWHATGKAPSLALLAGMVVFLLVLNPVKAEYRQQVWFGGEATGLDQRLGVWTDLIQGQATAVLDPERAVENQADLTTSLARFDLIHKFAYMQKLTPAVIPYYGGETYSYFIYAWIPRVLWPDKPTASDANNRLDVDYRLKLKGQGSTISIGQLPEAYANFGLWGVVIVMALQGFILSLLNSVLNGPRSEGGRVIYLTLLIYFLNGIGSLTIMLYGALLQHILANALILRGFAGRFQAPPDEKLPVVPPPTYRPGRRQFGPAFGPRDWREHR